MQSRHADFYCVERGSDFISQSCKLREWAWHFGTCSLSAALEWVLTTERMKELNLFNVWLNCSSRAWRNGTSGYTDLRKWNSAHPTNYNLEALRLPLGGEARRLRGLRVCQVPRFSCQTNVFVPRDVRSHTELDPRRFCHGTISHYGLLHSLSKTALADVESPSCSSHAPGVLLQLLVR